MVNWPRVRQVVTREMIEQHIWNYDFECQPNVIDVYVRRLQTFLNVDAAESRLITRRR